MPDYRRFRVQGGTAFFTVNLLQRRGASLLTDRIGPLRDAVRRVHRRRPFTIDAWVVLPDHLHAVWTLPPGDDDISTRWRLIRRSSSAHYRVRNGFHPRAGERANAASGSGGSGSMPFSTTPIMRRTWTTGTSIRSSTATSRRRTTGRTRRSAPALRAVSIPRGGAARACKTSRPANLGAEASGGIRRRLFRPMRANLVVSHVRADEAQKSGAEQKQNRDALSKK